MATVVGAAKLRVFISYSRVDEVFADELRLGLEDRGYEVAIDKHSIRPGEEWRPRLKKLIADNSTVVFVLSPDSARSKICQWEVNEAHRQAKRIIPAMHRGLDEPPLGKDPDGHPWPPGVVKAPDGLTMINYPRFDGGRSFMAGLRQVVEALEADKDWIVKHSRLANRARDWDEDGRSANWLMSSEGIRAAEQLVAERKDSSPPILVVQTDYIEASKAHETEQASARERALAEREKLVARARVNQRRASWFLAATCVVILGAMILTGMQIRDNAVQAASNSLAEAENEFSANRCDRALLATTRAFAIADNALSSSLDRSISNAAKRYILECRVLGIYAPTSSTIRRIAHSANGEWIAIGTEQGDVSVIDTRTGALLYRRQADGKPIAELHFSHDNKHFLVSQYSLEGRKDSDPVKPYNYVLSTHSWNEMNRFPHENNRRDTPKFMPNKTVIAVAGGEVHFDQSSSPMRHWRGDLPLAETRPGVWPIGPLTNFKISTDGRYFAEGYSARIRVFDAKMNKMVIDAPIDGFVNDMGHQPSDRITVLDFSPDNSLLLTVSNEGAGRLWDLSSGQQLRVFRGHAGRVESGALSRDKKFVATAATDGTAIVWSVETGEQVAALSGHAGEVLWVSFPSRPESIFTAGIDGSIRQWNYMTGVELWRYQREASITAATLIGAGDGEVAFVAYEDGTVFSFATRPSGERFGQDSIARVSNDELQKFDDCKASELLMKARVPCPAGFSARVASNTRLSMYATGVFLRDRVDVIDHSSAKILYSWRAGQYGSAIGWLDDKGNLRVERTSALARGYEDMYGWNMDGDVVELEIGAILSEASPAKIADNICAMTDNWQRMLSRHQSVNSITSEVGARACNGEKGAFGKGLIGRISRMLK